MWEVLVALARVALARRIVRQESRTCRPAPLWANTLPHRARLPRQPRPARPLAVDGRPGTRGRQAPPARRPPGVPQDSLHLPSSQPPGQLESRLSTTVSSSSQFYPGLGAGTFKLAEPINSNTDNRRPSVCSHARDNVTLDARAASGIRTFKVVLACAIIVNQST